MDLVGAAHNPLSFSKTHTRRWHVTKNTVGQGHLYQGRFKSFLCAQDSHLLTVLRYVERNAKTANLVQKAEDWQWSSIWRREFGNIKEKAILSDWPMPYPDDYLELLNLPLTPSEEEKLVKAEEKNIPYGSDAWQFAVVGKYHLQQAMRERGRPKKGG